jgi:hypothetical protein
MKKLMALLLVAIFCLSIASCYFPGRGGGGHQRGGQHHDGGHRR